MSRRENGKTNEITRSKVTGYSGNADATAFAPAIFVVLDKPTKNSRPKQTNKLLLIFT
jgi:hypothetical protein